MKFPTSKPTFIVPLIFFAFLLFFMCAGLNAHASEVTLAWNPNTESDIAGYVIYYKTGMPGAPYDGVDLDQGDSGIDIPLQDLNDPDAPQYKLTGLNADWTYYFIVTAYNDQGLESGYSNEIVYKPSPPAVFFTITASSSINGSISPSGVFSVAQGASQTYVITPEANYHIENVSVDGVSVGNVSSYAFENVTTDHTISAIFAANTYTITASAGTNGSITPSGDILVGYGGNQTFSIVPNAGYFIQELIVDGQQATPANSYEFVDVKMDHSIEVKFAPIHFTITASAGGNGEISPAGPVQVAAGGDQTFSITPSPGYHIADVTIDGNSIGSLNSYTFFDVSADHAISATFVPDTYTLTSSSGDNGTITPAGTTTVPPGANQNFIISPASHYHVADVLVDGASVGAVTTYLFENVSENHRISASFEIDKLPISANAGSNGSLLPSGTVMVDYGKTQTFTITPAAEYDIADVIVDGLSLGAIPSYTFANVTNSHTIEAVFKSQNTPPLADAGPDQILEEGSIVNLNGINSIDLDDGIQSYNWEQISGTSVHLSGTTEAAVSFLAPDVDMNGESLVFRLTVTDYQGLSAEDSCIVNVSWINAPPVALAGPDQSASEGSVVILNALQSYDEDDGIASYSWEQIGGEPVTLSDPHVECPTFTAPTVTQDGSSLRFQLTVTDKGGLISQDSCIVNVSWKNDPPVANAGADQIVDTGVTVSLDGSGSADPDDGIALYRWNQISGSPVTLSDVTAVRPEFVAPETIQQTDPLRFRLTVTDTAGLQHSDACDVFIRPVDTTPPLVQILSPTNEPTYVYSKRKLDIAGTASDDTGVVSVTWQNSQGETGTATGTDNWQIENLWLERGNNQITITATDASGNQASANLQVIW